MKAITLTQPWATLVAIGAKRIETRGWYTSYRGPLAIHAAKRIPADAMYVCGLEPFASALAAAGFESCMQLPLGEIVATSELVACFPTESEEAQNELTISLPDEISFGDYAPGRRALVLERVQPVVPGIPCRGMLGIWELPPGVLRKLGVANRVASRETARR